MAYEYVNSFLLLLHPHFLIKNGGEAVIYYLMLKNLWWKLFVFFKTMYIIFS